MESLENSMFSTFNFSLSLIKYISNSPSLFITSKLKGIFTFSVFKIPLHIELDIFKGFVLFSSCCFSFVSQQYNIEDKISKLSMFFSCCTLAWMVPREGCARRFRKKVR